MWKPGDQLLIRHILGGRVLLALPMTVVEAAPEQLVTWVAPGTPVVYPLGRENGMLLPLERWSVEHRTWFGSGALDVTPAGRAYMIRHFWAEDGSFLGWYVNLQEPLRASGRGFDTADHQLDLWITPDDKVVWKDEDDLRRAVAYGIFNEAEAAAARAEASRVLEEWPFPTGWEEWRPDPTWSLPRLPQDWNVL
jgi:hypothetical protein